MSSLPISASVPPRLITVLDLCFTVSSRTRTGAYPTCSTTVESLSLKMRVPSPCNVSRDPFAYAMLMTLSYRIITLASVSGSVLWAHGILWKSSSRPVSTCRTLRFPLLFVTSQEFVCFLKRATFPSGCKISIFPVSRYLITDPSPVMRRAFSLGPLSFSFSTPATGADSTDSLRGVILFCNTSPFGRYFIISPSLVVRVVAAPTHSG